MILGRAEAGIDRSGLFKRGGATECTASNKFGRIRLGAVKVEKGVRPEKIL